MNVLENIIKSQKPLHVSLFDPEKDANLEENVKKMEKFGTDIIFVGGSTNIEKIDEFVSRIKNITDLPVILFPGGTRSVTEKADAILFMSLMNSKDPLFITGLQAKNSMKIKNMDIEYISTGYVIIEPGMKVGEVGKADLIKRNDIETCVNYSLAAEMLGMKILYIEAGSGAYENINPEMIKAVKKAVDIPVIVGGGINTPEKAKSIIEAGPDLIVTGNLIESNPDAAEEIIKVIKNSKNS